MIGVSFAAAVFLLLSVLPAIPARPGRPRAPIRIAVLARFIAVRRREAVRRELAGALVSLATSIRAGLSLPQAIRAAAESRSGPLGEELGAVDAELGRGAGLDQALSGMEKRCPVPEMKLMVAGLMVARASGGGLAPLLERLAGTMREREELRGQVRALTAQGRLSGWVVGLVPLALIFLIFLMLPDKVSF